MSEVIYMYRRKGQDAWATCDENRYLELGGSHLFEVRIIHTGNEYAALHPTHPAPAEQVEVVAWAWECLGDHVTADKVQAAVLQGDGVPLEPLVRLSDAQRILAATVPAGCKVVPVELLQRVIDYYCEGDGELKCIAQDCRAILEAKDE